MNKRLLITDIITLSIGIILLFIVQLMMEFNPSLLINKSALIISAVILIIFGLCITISHKSNTEEVTFGNIILHITFAVITFVFYNLPALHFSDFYGIGNSVCIAFAGIFCSRFAFSFSNYCETNNYTGRYKINDHIEMTLFQKNSNYELYETMNIIGYVFLIVSTIAIIYNTFNPCFNVAFFGF